MFGLSFIEIVVIVVVAILVFGPNLPKVAAEFAGWIVKFRRSLNDLRRESGIDREIEEVRRQVENSIPREVRHVDIERGVRTGVETLKREVGEPVVRGIEEAREASRAPNQRALPAPSDAAQAATHDRREGETAAPDGSNGVTPAASAPPAPPAAKDPPA